MWGTNAEERTKPNVKAVAPSHWKIQMELEVESVRVLAGTSASYQRLLGLGAIWVGPEEFCILSILVSS